MSALLEIRDLHVAYGKVEAVHGVSLTVDAARIVTVIGPNGAGKTTLLAAIMGLLPSRGEIRYDGAPLAAGDVEQRVARGVTLVPEKRELFASMSVADNLELGGFQRYRAGDSNARRIARRHLRPLPAARRAPGSARRHAVRWGAADARAGPRADGQAEIADARRTEPGSGAADRQGDIQHHRGAQGHRGVHPAGRAERAGGAAGFRLRLRARNRRARDRGPERVARGRPARRRDLSRTSGRWKRTKTDAISVQCTGFRFGVVGGLVSRNARPDNTQRFLHLAIPKDSRDPSRPPHRRFQAARSGNRAAARACRAGISPALRCPCRYPCSPRGLCRSVFPIFARGELEPGRGHREIGIVFHRPRRGRARGVGREDGIRVLRRHQSGRADQGRDARRVPSGGKANRRWPRSTSSAARTCCTRPAIPSPR